MNISVEKLLHKIEEELKEAKDTNSNAKIRERVHAIKTMCELILEESTTVTNSTTTTSATVNNASNLVISNPAYSRQVASMPNQQERLIIDEESNGESIFDF